MVADWLLWTLWTALTSAVGALLWHREMLYEKRATAHDPHTCKVCEDIRKDRYIESLRGEKPKLRVVK